MYLEVGFYDAKTKLPELLREVQRGRCYTITLRGQPVADLVPSAQGKLADLRAAIAAMRAIPRVAGCRSRRGLDRGGAPMSLVLDASMCLAWIFERANADERQVAERVLDTLSEQQVLVPALWHIEIDLIPASILPRRQCAPTPRRSSVLATDSGHTPPG